MRHFLAAMIGSLIAGGCALPPIDLTTSEPIKVDINMRLDVYQYEAEGAKPTPSPSPKPNAGADVTERRANRAADVQVFKNSRLVGEGRNGLLVVLEETPGDYGVYIREVVAAENADRMEHMKKIAEDERRSLADVQKEQAELWRNRSFKGEYIEVAEPGGKYVWKQKEG